MAFSIFQNIIKSFQDTSKRTGDLLSSIVGGSVDAVKSAGSAVANVARSIPQAPFSNPLDFANKVLLPQKNTILDTLKNLPQAPTQNPADFIQSISKPIVTAGSFLPKAPFNSPLEILPKAPFNSPLEILPKAPWNNPTEALQFGKTIALDTVRAAPRAAFKLGMLNSEQAIDPNSLGIIGKTILGDQPLKSSIRTGRETLQDIGSNFGLDPNSPLSIAAAGAGAVPFGLALTGLDLIPGMGGEKKAAEKVAEGVLKQVAKRAPEVVRTAETAFDARKYVDELVAAREAARKASQPTIKETIGNAAQVLKTKLVDFTAPIEDALYKSVNKNKDKFSLLPKYNIRNQIDRTLRADTIAGSFIKDNGLDKIVTSVDDIEAFGEYLNARRNIELSRISPDIKTGRDITKDTMLVNALKNQYEPIAQQVKSYTDNMLNYMVDAGMQSKESANLLKTKYNAYVRWDRVFTEAEKAIQEVGGKIGSTPAPASLSKQTVVQKMLGSNRAIENPLGSMVDLTRRMVVQGEKNKAARILASYKDLPGNPMQIRRLKEGEKASDFATFSVLRDGKKEIYETTPAIARAAKALNVQQIGTLGKILSFPVRVARVGITGLNVPFILKNIPRDIQSGFINAKKGMSIANPAVFIRALFSAVKHDKLYDELMRMGAGGTSFDLTRATGKETVEKLVGKKNLISKVKYTAKHPSELIRAVEDTIGRSEEFGRLANYKGTLNAYLKEGRTVEDAQILAAMAARENTANFARYGEYGKVLNGAFLYMNAGIQGSRSFYRAMRDRPIQTAAKVATTLLFPTAMLTAWNIADPKRRQVYEDINERDKENYLILIPPNPTQDADGAWNVIKIPLPIGMNKLAVPVRHAIEQTQGLSEVSFADIANALIGSVSPEPLPLDKQSINELTSDLIPQAIKPLVESKANYNYYFGNPIVSKKYEDLSPEKQVKPTTSGTVEQLAKLLPGEQSPIQLEQLINSTFGGLSKNILNTTDQALATVGVIPQSDVHGKSILDSVLSVYTKVRGNDIDEKLQERLDKAKMDQADARFDLQNKALDTYEKLKALDPNEALQKLKAIGQQDPILGKQIVEIIKDEKLGLTYQESAIKSLGVENGMRAQFIYEEVMKLKSPDEKNAFINNLINKGVVTSQVYQQLKRLVSGQ